MLRDPRSHALVDSFANQWLKLGKLSGIVPDVDEFPDFDENLRDALQQETRSSSPASCARIAASSISLPPTTRSSTNGSRATTRFRRCTAATSAASRSMTVFVAGFSVRPAS